ncbi:uncharacterized protein [Nicotiana tomentosiformis]|uniref:uncharacterized protein n=1 Tax=Nicotiana tomentosiformis TaxID=4098 RepID=UPI00388CBC44
MPQAAMANFLASEGIRRLIHEKEELSSERDQLLAERDRTVLCLSELETRATEADVLEARLQQSEQEVVALSQEVGSLRAGFDEVKAKWDEVQNAIFAANDREATAAERVTNLEAALNSKAEELAAAGARHAQLEKKYKKTIEHNRLYSSTIHDLDVSLRSASMRRNTLKRAKAGIFDIDAEISKASELELAAKKGLPAQSDAQGSSYSGSDISDTEEE